MKRRMMYSCLGVLASVLFLLSAVPSGAEEQSKHMGPPPEEHMGPSKGHHMEAEMAEGEKAAGLSQEQRDKMKALREEFRGKQKASWEQIKARREDLRKELDSTNPDRGKAEALAKEINDLQGQAAISRIDEVFKLRSILTPEQFQKLRDFHQKNREKMKDKMKDKMGDRAGKRDGWRGHGGMWGEEHGEK